MNDNVDLRIAMALFLSFVPAIMMIFGYNLLLYPWGATVYAFTIFGSVALSSYIIFPVIFPKEEEKHD